MKGGGNGKEGDGEWGPRGAGNGARVQGVEGSRRVGATGEVGLSPLQLPLDQP